MATVNKETLMAERRAYNREDHERLIKIEVLQKSLVAELQEHKKDDQKSFDNLNDTIKEVKDKQEDIAKTQVKLTTTVWLVGCFITVMVPVITAFAIHAIK